MSKISSGANYIQRGSSTPKRLANIKKSPLAVIVSGFFALVLMLMSAQPLLSGLHEKSEGPTNLPVVAQTQAAGISFICSENMGHNMNTRGGWKSFLSTPPQYDAKNRSWTAEEAIGNQIGFINYHGEGEGSNYFVADKKEPNIKKLSKAAQKGYTDNLDKFKGLRTATNCVNQTIGTTLANVVMGFASGATGITKMIVVFAFDSNVICEKPTDKGACINLLKIIGGTGSSSGGIIGVLTSGIYMPLLVMMVAITGFWVAKTAFKDRKYREALFGFIWIVLSVILGLAMLLNPALLAKAPMAASNTVASCVIGAFNGDNCFNNTSTGSSIDINNTDAGAGSKNICRSTASGLSVDEGMSLAVNSLSCSIWKAFILEPLAQGNFGTSVANLDTTGGSPTSAVIKKAGLDPKDFCINLSTSGSASSMEGKRLKLDGTNNEVCNLLIYQGFLQTNASSPKDKVGTPSNNNAQDPRWYNIAVVAANDSGMWNQWGSSGSGGLHKTGIALLALFTSGLGGFILIVVSIFALIYYFSSVLLMAFAPIFLLLGVHPGRGKKLLFGWLEKVISNVVKYLISAVFLIVAIALYGAILGNSNNMGTTLLFILIISGALFLYRKEIIDLIGKTNMGGEQVSSKLSERLGGMVKGTAKIGAAGAGSALGARIAGGSLSSGMKDGIKRSIQRGDANEIVGKGLGGIVTNAARQYNRNTVDNAQDIKTKAREEATRRDALKSQLDTATLEESNIAAEIDRVDSDASIKKVELERSEGIEGSVSEINNEVARDMMGENPFFGQAMLMLEQLKSLKLDLRIAKINGDEDEIRRINGEISEVTSQRAQLMDQIPEKEARNLNRQYQQRTRRGYALAGIEDYNPRDRVAYEELVGSTYKDQSYRDDLVDRANKAAVERQRLIGEYNGANVVADLYNETDLNRQPGDDFNTKFVDKIDKKAQALRDESIADADSAGRTIYSNKDLYQLGYIPDSGTNPPNGSPLDDNGPANDPTPTTPIEVEPVAPTAYNDGNEREEYTPESNIDQSSESLVNNDPVINTNINNPIDNRVNNPSNNSNEELPLIEYERADYDTYQYDRGPEDDYDEERENYYSGKYDDSLPEFNDSEPARSEQSLPVIDSELPEVVSPVVTPKVEKLDLQPEVLPTVEAPKIEKRDTQPEALPTIETPRPIAETTRNNEDIIPRVSDAKFNKNFANDLNSMRDSAATEFEGTKYAKEFEMIYGKLEEISRSDTSDLGRVQSELDKVSRASDNLEDRISTSSPEDLGPIASQFREEIDFKVNELFDHKSSHIESRNERLRERNNTPVDNTRIDNPTSLPSEPIRVDSTKAEFNRVEPVSVEPIRSAPARVEPIKAESTRVEPTKVEPVRSESNRVEPVKAGPTHVEPTKVESVRSEPTKVEPVKAAQTRVEPTKIEPVRSETTPVQPTKVEPVKAEPTRVEPVKSDAVRPEAVRQDSARETSNSVEPVERKLPVEEPSKPSQVGGSRQSEVKSAPDRAVIDAAVAEALAKNNSQNTNKSNLGDTVSRAEYEDLRKNIISEMRNELAVHEDKYNAGLDMIENQSRRVSDILGEDSLQGRDFKGVQERISQTKESKDTISKAEYQSIMSEIDSLKKRSEQLPPDMHNDLMGRYAEIEENFEKAMRAKNDRNNVRKEASTKIGRIDSDYKRNSDVDETVRIKPVNDNPGRPNTRRNLRGGLPIKPDLDD